MTQRLPIELAPGLLEDFAHAFDDLFERRSQREGFRRSLEGLLLPAERNKTLTGLAHTEPVVGASAAPAQRLQWFLSESNWEVEAVNRRRLELLEQTGLTAPTVCGVLAIDETGDRKWGGKTAHVGRQYLGSIGKVDNGVVTVHALWADERLYVPVELDPYTPAHWFAQGKQDEAFRTKPAIALELVDRVLAQGWPFRAVVADAFYGSHKNFRAGLKARGVGYVLALGPEHNWWHSPGQIGSVREAAQAAPWKADRPGRWQALRRRFRDGSEQHWWALEATAGPFGPDKPQRLIVATTDPATLPEAETWYLVSNLPAPGSTLEEGGLQAATLAEVVRLYGLRVWIEQTYKQVKNTLGWAEYQVRSDLAMRRHWALVCCALSFCWWALAQTPLEEATEGWPPAVAVTQSPSNVAPVVEKKIRRSRGSAPPHGQLARRPAPGTGVAGTLYYVTPVLAGVVQQAPTRCFAAAA